MTTEDDCPCTDTSDATSLPLDISSSALNSSELADVSTGECVQTNNDCTCLPDEKLPAETARASSPPAVKPPPANHQPQRGPFKGTPHFQPALQCICHAYRADQFAAPDKHSNAERFNWKWPRREYARKLDEVCEVKVKRNHYRHYSKPYVRGDGTEGIPRRKNADFAEGDLGPPRYTDTKQELEEISERIDIYYFDHGNSAYYRTTDSPPILATERCAEKTDSAATRFWAEIFGTIHIGVSFITAFVLQLLRFLLFSIIRPLTVGILQLFADYFVKPLLSILFNALIQPILILLYNVATSLRDLCEPVAEALGFFLREVAAVFRAFRIVEVNRIDHATTTTTCT